MATKTQSPTCFGKTVAVDFETRAGGDYSVKDMGLYAYVHDVRFDAYLVAVTDGTRTIAAHPGAFDWKEIDGRVWVSHNRDFDKAVFERLQELGRVPSDVRPAAWYCSAAACAFLQLPRDLAGAAKAVLGITLDKSVRDRMLDGTGDLFDDLGEYAAADAKACFALWEKVSPHWPDVERELFELTSDMGARGITLDTQTLVKHQARLHNEIAADTATMPYTPIGSLPKFAALCGQHGITPPATTAADDPLCEAWLNEHAGTEPARVLQQVHGLRKKQRMAALLASMADRLMPNGRMAFELKYCGAGPGRWSGGGGLNVQNLNRAEAGGVDLRALFVAAPGHTFIVADYAQIEARVLLWLAGDNDTLDVIRSGVDLYEAHARATMGYTDPRPLKEVNPKLRQLAKARCLGLGFGLGKPERFVLVAKTMAGIDLDEQTAARTITEYRKSNPKVVELWARLDTALKNKHGGTYSLPFPCTQRDPSRKRFLIYRDIDVQEDKTFCTIGGRRCEVYGGLIAENWTQGTARDILAEAWRACASVWIEPVLSVHDELVFEVDDKTAEQTAEEVKRIMQAPPVWAPGLPLAVDVKITKIYEK